MNKPPAPPKKHGKKHLLPDTLSPVLAQAVPAVEETAPAPEVEPDAVPAGAVAEALEDQEAAGLLGIPLLGPTRRRALADAGIATLDDLRAAPVERIGGVKGVGLRNAARIKEWLAARPQEAAPPPPPPSCDRDSSSPDPQTAEANQMRLDEWGRIDGAITRIQEAIARNAHHKRLERQFDRLTTVMAELAEGPDTLSTTRVQKADRLLDRIAQALENAACEKKLSQKRQEALREKVKAYRKELQKTLGD